MEDKTLYNKVNYDISSIKKIFFQMKNDSLFLYINNERKIFLKLNPNLYHNFIYPRLVIGTNSSNSIPFQGIIKTLKIQLDNLPKIEYDFSTSLRDINSGNFELKVMTRTHLPFDAFGISSMDYSSELTEYYKYWGFENYIWTVDDINEMKKMLMDKNIDGILSDYPGKLMYLVYPKLKLSYFSEDNRIKISWEMNDWFMTFSKFEIQKYNEDSLKWGIVSTINNDDKFKPGFIDTSIVSNHEYFYRLRIIKEGLFYFSDTLKINLNYPDIKLKYLYNENKVKLFWLLEKKYADILAFEIQKRIKTNINWFTVDTINNDGRINFNYSDSLVSDDKKYGYRLKLLKQCSYSYSDSLNVDLYINNEAEDLKQIKEFILYQNYPNPFNSETVISYTIPQNGRVKINIFDGTGRKVMTPVDKVQSRGRYFQRINFKELTSSVYFYTVEFRGTIISKKMLYLK